MSCFAGRTVGRCASACLNASTGLLTAQGMTPDRVKERNSKLAIWVREGLVKLGPTFIKIGQQFSTRVDVLSPEFVKELEKLQVHIHCSVHTPCDLPRVRYTQSFSAAPKFCNWCVKDNACLMQARCTSHLTVLMLFHGDQYTSRLVK